MEPMELFPESVVRRLSLVRLSAELARSVTSVGRVIVEGEVVRPRALGSGRTYFTLRDRAAQISVVVTAARAGRSRVVHGERVAVTGSVTYASDRGQLQLAAEEVTPVGAGAIAALQAEVRGRLRASGLLDRPRRRVPVLPGGVGVVCGSEAAVKADIESVVEVRFPGFPVRFVEVNVSGPGAADSIVAGVRSLDSDRGVDVIVLARGGGDAAQLLPFSDEALCRALCATRVPVVTAIGHEGDRPLCDEVADLRCATPSLAAAAVVPDRRELEADLAARLQRGGEIIEGARRERVQRLLSASPARALDARSGLAAARLDRCRGRMVLVDPAGRLRSGARALERVDIHAPATARLGEARRRLADRGATLDALDPSRVLRRGYAVVRAADGRVVRDPAQVAGGDPLSVRVAGGTIGVEVTGTDAG